MNSTLTRIAGSVLVCAALAGCTASATPAPTATPPTAPATIAASPTAGPTPTLAPTPSPSPTPAPTAAPPTAPANVVKTDLAPPAKCPTAYGASCFAYMVSWTEANPTGVTIKLYAVTKCLAKPHCLTAATSIPAADLALLGTDPAGKGSLTFVVGDGATYGDGWLVSKGKTLYMYAVVLQATSASGASPFVIAWTW